ncbi:Hypothetical protein NTJ_10356 [Nesidiocoris tenuis]|uniref:Uncharacterized protein n=1 Tax=Nesidiocoris tenuis TaxID=355587 RepID=A0ABN7AZD9_9HEMI|nr:Hypothetical protein NTJ_10356 [Nesidiocoris tenuis]
MFNSHLSKSGSWARYQSETGVDVITLATDLYNRGSLRQIGAKTLLNISTPGKPPSLGRRGPKARGGIGTGKRSRFKQLHRQAPTGERDVGAWTRRRRGWNWPNARLHSNHPPSFRFAASVQLQMSTEGQRL